MALSDAKKKKLRDAVAKRKKKRVTAEPNRLKRLKQRNV